MTRPSIRRLGRTLAARETAPFVKRIYTTVATVTPAAARDGRAAVSITDGADTIPCSYNANYTPTVGDHVAVDLVNGSPVIAFQVVGYPNI